MKIKTKMFAGTVSVPTKSLPGGGGTRGCG